MTLITGILMRILMTITKLRLRLVEMQIELIEKNMEKSPPEEGSIRKKGVKYLQFRYIVLNAQILILHILGLILRVVAALIDVLISMFPTVLIIVILVAMLAGILLLIDDYLDKDDMSGDGLGYYKEVCYSGEFQYSQEEYNQYKGQFTEKQDNMYKFAWNYKMALEGTLTGQPALTKLPNLSTREKLELLVGIFAVENGGKWYEGDQDGKDINRDLSNIAYNYAGYGLLGLKKGSSLTAGDSGNVDLTLDSSQLSMISNFYTSNFSPVGLTSSNEGLYIPYAQNIVAYTLDAEGGYVSRALSKSYTHRPIDEIYQEVIASLNIPLDKQAHFKDFATGLITLAHYHGSISTAARDEHRAMAQLAGEIYMQTNALENINVKSTVTSFAEGVGGFRTAWFGTGNEYRGLGFRFSPTGTIKNTYFELNGADLNEPLLPYLYKNAVNKTDFDNIIVPMYNRFGAGEGHKDRVLNFHYGVAARLLGRHMLKTVENEFSLGSSCQVVWHSCSEAELQRQGIGGFTGPGGSYVTGAQVTGDINDGTSGQIQGPWSPQTRAKMNFHNNLFGGYDAMSQKEVADKLVANSKWKTRYERQTGGCSTPRSCVKLGSRTIGAVGCHYYGLAYVASAFTRTNINVVEYVAGALATGGASRTSISLQGNYYLGVNDLGIYSTRYTRDGFTTVSAENENYFAQNISAPKSNTKEGLKRYADEVLDKNGMILASFTDRLIKGADGKSYNPVYSTDHFIVITGKTGSGPNAQYSMIGYNDLNRDATTYTWDTLYASIHGPNGRNNTKMLFFLDSQNRATFTGGVKQTSPTVGSSKIPKTYGRDKLGNYLGEDGQPLCLPGGGTSGGTNTILDSGAAGTSAVGDGPQNLNGLTVAQRNMLVFGSEKRPARPENMMEAPIYAKAFQACGLSTPSLATNRSGKGPAIKEIRDCLVNQGVMVNVTYKHFNYDGTEATRTELVHKALANSFSNIMNELYSKRVPLNSSGTYNWRTMDSGGLSFHAFGAAIDINADVNPHQGGGPRFGAKGSYVPCNESKCRSMGEKHPIPTVFQKYGWAWGAYFTRYDYMHFEAIPATNYGPVKVK